MKEEVVLWENTAPNSLKLLRPVYLIREAETDAKLLDEVIGTTDSVRKDLEEENQMYSFKGEEVIIQLEISEAIKDLQLKRKRSGLGGADLSDAFRNRMTGLILHPFTKDFRLPENQMKHLGCF